MKLMNMITNSIISNCFSDPIDVQPEKLEMLCLKNKRLCSSKSQMKSQLTEAKNTVNKYEAEKKLMHVSTLLRKTLTTMKRK